MDYKWRVGVGQIIKAGQSLCFTPNVAPLAAPFILARPPHPAFSQTSGARVKRGASALMSGQTAPKSGIIHM